MIRVIILIFLSFFSSFGLNAQTSNPPVEPNADPVLHVNNINTCDLSKDGKVLATGDEGGTLTLWDVETKKAIRRLDFKLPVIEALIVDDDKTVISIHSAVTSWDMIVALTNVSDGTLKRQYKVTTTTHPANINLDTRYFIDSTFHIDYNKKDLILFGNFNNWYLFNLLEDKAPKKIATSEPFILGHFDPKDNQKILFYYKDENQVLQKSRHALDGSKIEDIQLPMKITMKDYSLKKEYRTSVSSMKFYGNILCVPDAATEWWTGDYYFYDLKNGYTDTIAKNEFYHQIRDVQYNSDGSQIALATGFVTGRNEAANRDHDKDVLGDVVIGFKNVRSQSSHLSKMSKEVHHRLGVNKIFWTDEDRSILSVGDDKLIIKTDVNNTIGINELINPNPGQIFYDVSKDLKQLVFTRPGQVTGLWNLTDMNATLLEQEDKTNMIIRFLANDSTFITANNDLAENQLKTWNQQIRNNWNNDQPLKNGFANITNLEPSKLNNTVYIAGNYNSWRPPSGTNISATTQLVKMNVDSMQIELNIPLGMAQVEDLTLSSDEQYIACRPPNTVRTEIYQTTTGQKKKFQTDIWRHAFSRDNTYAASILKGLELVIWNTANDFNISVILEDWPDNIIFRQGTNELLLIYRNGIIEHLNYLTGIIKKSSEIKKDFTFSPVISDDGRYIYVQKSDKGNLDSEIYDLVTNKILFSPKPHYPEEPRGLYENPRKNCHFGGDGFVLTGDNFGSYQLWDLKNRELAANLKILDLENWIIYTPKGLYDGTDKGRQKMYYSVGTEVIQLDQIMEKYWSPGLLENILARKNFPSPKPIVLYPQIHPDLNCDLESIRGSMTARNGGVGELNLFINGVKRPGDFNKERKLTFEVSLDTLYQYFISGQNVLSLQVFDQSGTVRSRDASCILDFSGSKGSAARASGKIDTSASKLYAVIIGTSKYDDKDLTLNYPDRDAREMSKMFRSVSTDLFDRRVNIYEMTSDARESDLISKKENLIKTLDEIKMKAGPNDVFIMFLSGHGEVVGDDFYYKTKEIPKGSKLENDDIQKKYLLSSKEISWYSERIKASKQLLIIDACKSGSAFNITPDQLEESETSRKKALENYLGTKGVFFLASSESDKNSFESSFLKNGLLTFSVLRGMSGGALKDDGTTGVLEILPLIDFASKETVAISDKLVGPEVKYTQRPQIKTLNNESESFQIGVVSDTIEFPKSFDFPYLGLKKFIDKEDLMTEDTQSFTDSLKSYLQEAGGNFNRDMKFFFWGGKPHKEVFQLLGNYTIHQDSITVFVGMKNQDQLVGHQRWIQGKLNNLNEVFARMVDAALIEIKELGENTALH